MKFISKIRDHLINWQSKQSERCIRRRNLALGRIESLYDEAIRVGGFTVAKSLVVNWHVALCHIFTIEFAIALVGTFSILGITGAFETDSSNLSIPAFVYWATLMLISAVVAVLSWLVVGPFHHMFRLSYWAIAPAFIMLTSTLLVLVALWFTPLVQTSEILLFNEILFPVIGLVSLGTILISYSGFRRTNFLHYIANNGANRLESLVPVAIRGRILAVSAQDHYVQIITDKGKHLHRMGLNEALKMLPENDGIHVHRSHWVNKTAIQSMKKSGNRHLVLLENKDEIPVSNSKLDIINDIIG